MLKLVVERLQARLLRLLLLLARLHLRLSAREARLLGARANVAKELRGVLEVLPVGLLGPKPHALLLLGRSQGLIVVLLIQGRDGLSLRKALLAHQLRPLQARALAAKGPATDGVCLLLGKLLPLLLVHRGLRGVDDALREGVHVLPDVQGAGVHTPSALRREAGGRAVVGLGGASHGVGVLNARLLRLREGRDEGVGVLAVGLIGRLRDGLGAGVDGIVSRQNFRRDLRHIVGCGRRSALAAAKILSNDAVGRLPEDKNIAHRAALRLFIALLGGLFPSAGAGSVKEIGPRRRPENALVHADLARRPLAGHDTDGERYSKFIRDLLAKFAQLASAAPLRCPEIRVNEDGSLF